MSEAARRFAAARGVAKLGASRVQAGPPGTRSESGTRGTRAEPGVGSTGDTQKTADFRRFLGSGTPGTRENHKVLLENRVSSAWGLTSEEREAGLRRLNGEGQHDAPEAEALAQHYAAPAEAAPPAGRDPLAAGLLRGSYAHRQVQEPHVRAPRVEACSCCDGTRWWREARNPTGWRCWRCHPGDHLRPEEREEQQG